MWTFENDSLFHFVKCSDDIDLSAPGIDLTSELFFNTTAGKTYYVQVGGCDGCTFGGNPTDDSGTLGLYVSPPPSNDSRGNAQTVNLGQNVARETDGAQGDGESVLNCGSRTYGKTVWYRFVVTQAGTATIDASGFDSAASLYAGSSASPFGCGVSPAGGATSISRRLGPGVYFAQVGGQGSGVGAARGNLNFKVSFVPDGGGGGGGGGTPPDPDSDGDGLVDSQDCADNDPKRRQGFKEIVGNSRDEDCDGTAQDFAQVRARRGPADYSAAARTRLSTLFVNRISAGDKVTITCRGKGCGRKRYAKRFGKARAKYNFAKAMRRNRPGRGAVLEVRVTHAQRIGHVWRYKFRFYKNPTVQEDLCLRPGAKTPKRCP